MIMVETRQGDRVRALLRARIIFNNRNSTIDCTIKNISTSGAKVALSNTVTVRAEFDLEVPQRGRTFRAHIVWRDAEALGVRFIEGEPATEPGDTSPERLRTENRHLKAIVAALTKRLEDLGQDVSLDR